MCSFGSALMCVWAFVVVKQIKMETKIKMNVGLRKEEKRVLKKKEWTVGIKENQSN